MPKACFDCPCDTRDTKRIHCCMLRWQDDAPAPQQQLSRQQRRALERQGKYVQ